jgi:hypothetical protein
MARLRAMATAGLWSLCGVKCVCVCRCGRRGEENGLKGLWYRLVLATGTKGSNRYERLPLVPVRNSNQFQRFFLNFVCFCFALLTFHTGLSTNWYQRIFYFSFDFSVAVSFDFLLIFLLLFLLIFV